MPNPSASAKRKLVADAVLALFVDFYRAPPPDGLDTDPNAFDRDPGPFYEEVVAAFGIAFVDRDGTFGGLGGTLAEMIDYVAAKWKLQSRAAIEKLARRARPARRVAEPARAVTRTTIDCSGVPALETGWKIIAKDQSRRSRSASCYI